MTEKCPFRAGPRGPLSPPDGTSWSWSIIEPVSTTKNDELVSQFNMRQREAPAQGTRDEQSVSSSDGWYECSHNSQARRNKIIYLPNVDNRLTRDESASVCGRWDTIIGPTLLTMHAARKTHVTNTKRSFILRICFLLKLRQIKFWHTPLSPR
jgi:hypothetical protein